MHPRYLSAGESALTVEFGSTADPSLHERVVALDAALAAAPIPGVRESVPTYRSLFIEYDPGALTEETLIAALERRLRTPRAPRPGRSWRLPVCYEPPHAEDLAEVAGALGRPMDEIARLHAGATYRVVMYGFAPGFVFLSGLPDALRISRRATPRPPAPPGALTIANGQALIASVAMPTGWYVLGRTPVRTFDPAREPMFPLAVGDEVHFVPMTAAEFAAREGTAEPERVA